MVDEDILFRTLVQLVRMVNLFKNMFMMMLTTCSPQCLGSENVTFVMDPDSKSDNVKIVNIVRFKQVDRKIYLVRLKSKIQIKPKYFFV